MAEGGQPGLRSRASGQEPPVSSDPKLTGLPREVLISEARARPRNLSLS